MSCRLPAIVLMTLLLPAVSFAEMPPLTIVPPRRDLEPFHEVKAQSLQESGSPSRITLLQQRSLTFILDTELGEVRVLDAEYDHTYEGVCVPLSLYPGLGHVSGTPLPAGRTACAIVEHEGTPKERVLEGMSVRRGVLSGESGEPVAAVAVQDGVEDTSVKPLLFLITRSGLAYVVDADANGSQPENYLWVDPAAVTQLKSSSGLPLKPGGAVFAAFERAGLNPTLWIASGETLRGYGFTGTSLRALPRVTHKLRGTARGLGLARTVPWVLTSYGLESPGRDVPIENGEGLALGATDAFISRPLSSDVLKVELSGLALAGRFLLHATGPIALDDRAQKLYAAEASGVHVLDAEASLGELHYEPLPDVLALAATRTHEIVAVTSVDSGSGAADNSVTVYFDETALVGDGSASIPPLKLTNQTFVEHPRDDDGTTCASEDMKRFATNLHRNAQLLGDLPGEFAIGIIPQSAEVLSDSPCTSAAFQEVWNGFHRHVGTLFHDDKLCTDTYFTDPATGVTVSDPTRYEVMLDAEIAGLEAATKGTSFIAGINTHSDLEVVCDWVGALGALGAPDNYLFFGAATLPTVDHKADVRAKDPFPLDTWVSARSYVTDDAARPDLDAGGPPGIQMVPGSDTPVFNLGGCGNLFILECQGRTDHGLDIERKDMEVLNLLIRRAIAVRGSDDRTYHWSFHLPCAAAYDYTTLMDGTANCSRSSSGIWTTVGAVAGSSVGECEAALLQEFFNDVYARFYLNGLVKWVDPSAL